MKASDEAWERAIKPARRELHDPLRVPYPVAVANAMREWQRARQHETTNTR